VPWIGWASSGVLLATIGYQVRRHWQAEDNGGVSRMLYFGQLAASTGFVVYSWQVGDWVFVVTNALLLATAICGIAIHHRNERRARREGHAGTLEGL
jgi:hypothetical protein